jgi:hypothetical protein
MTQKKLNLKRKVTILNEIRDDYNLEEDVYNKLVRTVKFDHSQKKKT